MAEFPVMGIRSVDLQLPDLEAALDFYTGTWGLSLAGRTADRAWLRGTGTDPHIVALSISAAPAIRSVTFRIRSDVDPDRLVAAMVALGARSIPEQDDEPHGGIIRAVRDPRGRTIRLVQDDDLVTPLPAVPDRPERLAHININSVDTDADCAFFIEALGFRLTDRSRMMGFVRTNSDHHSIVIADAAVNTLNHIAFQLPGWEGVMRAAGRMVDAGHPIGWGPGRHGPGNNVFTYFVDPFGFVIEHTADVLQVDHNYRVGGPADWVWPAGRTDQWGIAPSKTVECKAAQLAIPFA